MKRYAARAGFIAGLFVLVYCAIGFFGAQTACAHDPRFICSPRDGRAVEIPDPGKSWAYYGHLKAEQQDAFTFTVAAPLHVPWSLLIDARDSSDPARPYAIISDRSGREIAHLDFTHVAPFYEPFSRERYLQTNTLDLYLTPGTYTIAVSMRDGDRRQRYVMAIGDAERFTPAEIPYVLGAIYRIRARNF